MRVLVVVPSAAFTTTMSSWNISPIGMTSRPLGFNCAISAGGTWLGAAVTMMAS